MEAESAYKKGLQIARAQHDRRMEAFILLSLSRLFTAQEKFREANTFLRTAKEIATTEGYNDCLGWIYEEEGDIELLSEEPNASSILESFSVSLWHMCMFNEYELSKLIERLGRFWLAHAEDGQSATSLWFCESIIQLWKTMDQGNECRLVLEAFSSLRTRIMTMLQG